MFSGQSKQLPLLLYDDYGKDVTNISTVILSMNNDSIPNPRTIASRNVTIYGTEGTKWRLTVATRSTELGMVK